MSKNMDLSRETFSKFLKAKSEAAKFGIIDKTAYRNTTVRRYYDILKKYGLNEDWFALSKEFLIKRYNIKDPDHVRNEEIEAILADQFVLKPETIHSIYYDKKRK